MAGRKKLRDVIGLVHRHDAAARLAVRRVERNGERELQIVLRERVDARHHAAGGERDVPHPDVHAVGMVDKLQKSHHIRAVIERLADAHEHDVGNFLPRIELRKEHLIEHFRRRQVAHLAGKRRGAEFASHAAADL